MFTTTIKTTRYVVGSLTLGDDGTWTAHIMGGPTEGTGANIEDAVLDMRKKQDFLVETYRLKREQDGAKR